ncbi:MAG: M23 family metallopeptidase [Rubricoccaceae bacterium]|nr:M23 family metallopeptidase [Rubricoccaceae bacterium]
MRSAALLLPLLAALSACAPINGRPNGWAAPAGLEPGPRTAAPARADAPPVRPAAVRHEDPETPPASEAQTASGLLVPVAAVAPDELRDSFHAPRSGGRTHHAIDIAAPKGTPIVAVTDGTVVRKHWNRLGGNTLYLRSADGRYDFYYAHLDAYADGVKIGARVRRGDVIGTVGTTGNARGPHLHFQVLDLRGDGRGTPVNPYDLLRRADVARVGP